MADKAELYGLVGSGESPRLQDSDIVLLYGIEGASGVQALLRDADWCWWYGVTGASGLDATLAETAGSRFYGVVGSLTSLTAIPPAPADLTQGQETQSLSSAPSGKSVVTLSWSAPSMAERMSGELVGTATGGVDVFSVDYSPIESGEEVYEVTGYTSGGGDTTLSTGAVPYDQHLHVPSTTGFSADDWVEIKEGSVQHFAQIQSVSASLLTLKHVISLTFTTSATVKEVDVVAKTETTDYTINRSLGRITTVSGHFTSGKSVMVRYNPSLVYSVARFELYRVPGNVPLPDGCLRADVTGDPGCVTVNSNISSGATSYEETLTSDENGENWTYYLFIVDTAETPTISRSAAVLAETITSVPLSLSKLVGDSKVVLSWDAVSDANANGLNVYRCSGTWDASTAVKVNSIPVVGTSFEDGPGNTTNRRSAGEVPYPVNGSTYSYKVESQDTATSWTTGTQNQSSGVSENLTASKSI